MIRSLHSTAIAIASFAATLAFTLSAQAETANFVYNGQTVYTGTVSLDSDGNAPDIDGMTKTVADNAVTYTLDATTRPIYLLNTNAGKFVTVKANTSGAYELRLDGENSSFADITDETSNSHALFAQVGDISSCRLFHFATLTWVGQVLNGTGSNAVKTYTDYANAGELQIVRNESEIDYNKSNNKRRFVEYICNKTAATDNGGKDYMNDYSSSTYVGGWTAAGGGSAWQTILAGHIADYSDNIAGNVIEEFLTARTQAQTFYDSNNSDEGATLLAEANNAMIGRCSFADLTKRLNAYASAYTVTRSYVYNNQTLYTENLGTSTSPSSYDVDIEGMTKTINKDTENLTCEITYTLNETTYPIYIRTERTYKYITLDSSNGLYQSQTTPAAANNLFAQIGESSQFKLYYIPTGRWVKAVPESDQVGTSTDASEAGTFKILVSETEYAENYGNTNEKLTEAIGNFDAGDSDKRYFNNSGDAGTTIGTWLADNYSSRFYTVLSGCEDYLTTNTSEAIADFLTVRTAAKALYDQCTDEQKALIDRAYGPVVGRYDLAAMTKQLEAVGQATSYTVTVNYYYDGKTDPICTRTTKSYTPEDLDVDIEGMTKETGATDNSDNTYTINYKLDTAIPIYLYNCRADRYMGVNDSNQPYFVSTAGTSAVASDEIFAQIGDLSDFKLYHLSTGLWMKTFTSANRTQDMTTDVTEAGSFFLRYPGNDNTTVVTKAYTFNTNAGTSISPKHYEVFGNKDATDSDKLFLGDYNRAYSGNNATTAGTWTATDEGSLWYTALYGYEDTLGTNIAKVSDFDSAITDAENTYTTYPHPALKDAINKAKAAMIGRDNFTELINLLREATDTATGISEVTAESQASAPVYDLQGRRVANPVRGNIYITNGKIIRH